MKKCWYHISSKLKPPKLGAIIGQHLKGKSCCCILLKSWTFCIHTIETKLHSMAIKLRNNSNHQMRQKVHTRILTFTGHRNLDPINIKNEFFTRNNNHIFKRNGRFKRSIFYWWKTCGLIIGFKVGGWKQHHQAHLAEKYIYCNVY